LIFAAPASGRLIAVDFAASACFLGVAEFALDFAAAHFAAPSVTRRPPLAVSLCGTAATAAPHALHRIAPHVRIRRIEDLDFLRPAVPQENFLTTFASVHRPRISGRPRKKILEAARARKL